MILGEATPIPAKVYCGPSAGQGAPLWDVLPAGSAGLVIAVFEHKEMAEFFVEKWNARQLSLIPDDPPPF